jgi:HK97 family phage major capsid protein
MDTATAAEGLEWVPTALSADFIEKFRFGSRIASLFPDIAMPTNPFKLPYTGGLGADSFYLVGESISDSPAASPTTTLATGAQTLTAKKLKARIYFSEEITEQSIVPLLPHLLAEILQAGSEAIDDCVLNGDTTATHMDSDVTDSKDRRKIWNGLRDQCPAGTKVDLGTFATATLLSIVTAMGKYGITPQDLALITGPTGYNKLRLLTEVLTVDKYGPQATILNGELAKISGIPIIISEAVRQNLNATGVYDGSTTTKTIALLVNRKAAMLGSWMQVKMTYKEDAEVDQNQLILRFYKALAYRWTPSSTVTTIGLAYNIA